AAASAGRCARSSRGAARPPARSAWRRTSALSLPFLYTTIGRMRSQDRGFQEPVGMRRAGPLGPLARVDWRPAYLGGAKTSLPGCPVLGSGPYEVVAYDSPMSRWTR